MLRTRWRRQSDRAAVDHTSGLQIKPGFAADVPVKVGVYPAIDEPGGGQLQRQHQSR
ncbi:hypothetical protein [Paenibacillus sp. FSL L8-0709]|uniref:hypothetical protein n=1 Tax=Paenibacillus sp. FSL L8-0709 TaxID=2975312 RepID=UPI0030F6F9B9